MKMADLVETYRHKCKTNKLDPGVTDYGAVHLSLPGLWTVRSVQHTPKDKTFSKLYVSTTEWGDKKASIQLGPTARAVHNKQATYGN